MTKKYYYRSGCPTAPDHYNAGNVVEWRIGYELTGTPSRANNRKGTEGGDVGGWQVKSPKASIPEGDKCEGYIFGFVDEQFYYQMSRAEFAEFVQVFGYIARESHKNGGKTKIRLLDKSKRMLEWLDGRI